VVKRRDLRFGGHDYLLETPVLVVQPVVMD
jgi:hypothetical protein